MNNTNLLVDIANESENAYCIAPSHVHEAIRRGVTKADICIALVDCMAGQTGEFYMEDRGCCAFTALHEDYYKEAEAGRQPDPNADKDFIAPSQTTFKDYEGIAIKEEDTVQCKTYGTCKVTSISDTNIYIENTQTNETWDFDAEGWISTNWDLVASTPDSPDEVIEN